MFKKIKSRPWVTAISALVVVAIAIAGDIAWRAKRAYSVLRDWQAQVRHAAATGANIGSVPASRTFEASYLEAVFGSEPALLEQMKYLIAKGIHDEPTLNLGEVTAMIATYSKTASGGVTNVAVHVLGGFEVGKRRPGFNHDGFFSVQLDRNLFDTGNTVMSLLGRDMVVFADPATSHEHDQVLESIFSGDIMPLVGSITNAPIYFTAVFPDPKRVLPIQLRPHVNICILKGFLAPYSGTYETVLLAREPRSASYAMSVLSDLKLAGTFALRHNFDGIVHKTAWGNQVTTWWAFQMAAMLDDAKLEKQRTTVSMKADFDRKMVNATLKTIERFGRDVAVMRLIRDEKLDPRLADEKMRSNKPLNYWSNPHRWGPDWPIPPVSTNAPAAGGGIAPAATAPIATPQT